MLVVDDCVDAAKLMALVLKLEGYDSHVAFDGHAAVTAAEKLEPDVVFLDVTLPDMSGEIVANAIRNLAGLEHTVIVAVTGYDVDELPDPSGFDHHLRKPVDHERMMKLLAQTARKAER